MSLRSLLCCAVGLGTGLTSAVSAATVELSSVADTTLHGKFPDNNVGGNFDVAAGRVNSGELTRALLRFDLGDTIPSGATITSASLTVTVVREPSDGGVNATFDLRKMNRAWAEGEGTGNSGRQANAGETTWRSRFHPDVVWGELGGALGDDIAAESSSSAEIRGMGSYTFPSTRNLVVDVQGWLDNPAENHGWVLMSERAEASGSARRFGAREDEDNVARLTVEYIMGSNELRISDIRAVDTNVELSWQGGVAPFQLQRRDSVSASDWEDVGAPTSERVATSPAVGAMSYFRVIEVEEVPQVPEPPPVVDPPVVDPPTPVEPGGDGEVAEYSVAFTGLWGRTTHPQDYPGGAHWSPLIGGTHSAGASFWEPGELATRGIENVAELGSIVALRGEIQEAIAAGTAFNFFNRPGSIGATATVFTSFEVHPDFPLVTLVTMLAPSPDWFVGVRGLSLREGEQWVDEISVDLELYDSGTDSGESYASRNADTQPRERIHKVTGFPALVDGELTLFGRFTFTRVQ